MNESSKIKNYNLLDMKGRFFLFSLSKIKVKKNTQKSDLVDYLDQNLDIFKEGTPSKPGMGFRVIKEIDFPANIMENDEYRKFSERIIVIEYIQEYYTSKKQLDRTSLKIKSIGRKILTNYKKNYIFIIFPSLLIFKGGKESYFAIWDEFYLVAKKLLSIQRQYRFSEEFFLKILEKFWFKQNKIEEDFKIDFFRDLSTEGEKDFMGQMIDVRHSVDITRSLPILISFLGRKKPKKGLFDFHLKDNYYSIEINKNGSLVPRQQLGIFKNISQNERAFFGCYVVYRIIKFYEKWELLENTEKFITIDFIKAIVDFCKTQGFDVFKGSIDLINDYMILRGEIKTE